MRTTELTDSTGLFKVQDMLDAYLFGLDLSDSQGNPFPDSLFLNHLNSAVAYIERELNVIIGEKEFEEYHDYYASDYMNWGFLKCNYVPVLEVSELNLTYGTSDGMSIPKDWIKVDEVSGNLRLFPSSGSASSLVLSNSGTLLGLTGRWSHAPGMWRLKYKAGFKEVPADLKECVYKIACCNTLNVWGDLILGAGIASQSVGLDGLSQSIGTTQSAMYGGASARVNAYQEDVKKLLPALKTYYTGIKFAVI